MGSAHERFSFTSCDVWSEYKSFKHFPWYDVLTSSILRLFLLTDKFQRLESISCSNATYGLIEMWSAWEVSERLRS